MGYRSRLSLTTALLTTFIMSDSDVQKFQPKVTLKLFGVFNYFTDSASAISVKSRKAEAVMLALALSRSDGFEREHLSRLLWPDLTDERAKANLRQSLAHIRRVLGDVFTTPKSGWVALSSTLVSCDFWQITNSPLSNTSSQHKSKWPTEPFLVNYPEPTDLFSEWMVQSQQQAKNKIKKHALVQLADPALHTDQKEGLAQTLLLLDDVDEDGVAGVLEFLTSEGRMPQYETVLQNYKNRLTTQYDLTPSAEFLAKFKTKAPKSPMLASPNALPPPATPRAIVDTHSRPTLNVVPFEIRGDDDDVSYLGVALTEDIISRLSNQNWFAVNAHNTGLLYHPPGIGSQRPEYLFNTYSLKGIILVHQANIRITINLIDEATGQSKWARSYDAPTENIFMLQNDMVASIAEVLTSNVIAAESVSANIAMPHTEDDIWLSTMQARYLFWRMNQKNNRKARGLLDNVLEKTQTPPVPALITSVFVRLLDVWSLWSENVTEDLNGAIDLAERATRLYPSDPWTYFSLGTALGVKGKLDLSISTLNRSLAFNPNFAPAIGTRGKYKIFLGDLENARKDLLVATRLNDMDTHFGLWQNAMGIIFFLEDDLEKALFWSQQATSTNHFWAHNYLLTAACYIQLDRPDEAREAFNHAQKYLPQMCIANLKYSYPFKDKNLKRKFFEPFSKLGLC